MSTVPIRRRITRDEALIGAALELLAIQREHEQRSARTRHHVVAAARRSGLRWHEIGTALGLHPVTVRMTHQRAQRAAS